MTSRKTLLVGSLPFANEEEAMKRAVDVLGDTLLSLPDGEIGEKSDRYPIGNRSAWVSYLIDEWVADTENWQLVKEGVYNANGFPINPQSIAKVRPKKSPQEMIEHLNFHYAECFQQSYPHFQRIRAERNLQNLRFQVGIPTGLALCIIALPIIQAFRYMDAFNRRLAFEVNEILAQAKEDVVIQIEIPAEVRMALQLPKFMIGWVVGRLLQLIHYIQTPAQIGLHLCYGDLNNEAFAHPKTLHKVVAFANEIFARWPQTHQLRYLHVPLAAGKEPPTLSSEYYQPLQNLHIPEGTRFVAGFVHEKRSLDELKEIQQVIDQTVGYPVDVACSCGLGRRSEEVGQQLLERMQVLTSESEKVTV